MALGRRGRVQDSALLQSAQGAEPRVGVWLGVGGQGTGVSGGRPHSSPLVSSGCQAQQLAVRLEPQGLLYAKLTLSEQQEVPSTAEPHVFGLPLRLLVEREQPPGQVPLIIQKCVGQIERRGLRVSLSPHTPASPQTSDPLPRTPSTQRPGLAAIPTLLGYSELQSQPRQGQEAPLDHST